MKVAVAHTIRQKELENILELKDIWTKLVGS